MAKPALPTEEIYLPERLQRELINRLKRLAGHVQGIAGMIERKEPCEQILIQLTAVRSALNQVTSRLLEGHLDSCVKRCLHRGDEEAIEDFKEALSLFLKRI